MAELEPRLMLDASGLPDPAPAPPTPPISVSSWLSYYGLNGMQVTNPDGSVSRATGAGQTIVIISAERDGSYRNSNDPDWLKSGLAQYSIQQGLTTDFTFLMVNQLGDPTKLPDAATTAEDAREFDLDTQTVHTIAPRATIIDVVADSYAISDFIQAFQTALTFKPTVITMSYSWPEQSLASYADWAFTGGQGTTIVQSAGDSGAGMQNFEVKTNSGPDEMPLYLPTSAISPQTVMVGGSVLTPVGNSFLETAWGAGDDSFLGHKDKRASSGSDGGGSGGGYSLFLPRPAYQVSSPAVRQNQSLFPASSQGMRLGPDLDMSSKPGIVVLTYDPDSNRYKWSEHDDHKADPIGGTSLAAPTFAGAMALVGQVRAAAGRPALSSIDTLNFLYQAPSSAFRDIVQGNNGYPALPGFDLASGLGAGTPALWNYLSNASYDTVTTLALDQAAVVGGQTVTLTATVAANGKTPVGTVTFFNGNNVIGTATLDAQGRATLHLTADRLGVQPLSVSYAGQGLFAGSASGAVPLQVNPIATISTLTAGPAPSRRSVALTATVFATPSTPGGTVFFLDGGRTIGSAVLDARGQATLITNFRTRGVHQVTVVYAGQGMFAESSATITVRIGRGGRLQLTPARGRGATRSAVVPDAHALHRWA